MNLISHLHPHSLLHNELHSLKNVRQLKKMMMTEKYDIVHCHSPMGGVLARLSAKSTSFKKIIYTAHGFHFYKGAPVINWLVYYPVEKWLSRYTDTLITINTEDYKRADKFFANNVTYIPGVGIDTNKFRKNLENIEVLKLLKNEFKIGDHEVVLFSTGELNQNKNHKLVIKAIASIEHRNLKYFICGTGTESDRLKQLVRELGLEDRITFLGYRNDIEKWLNIADVFVFPSFREGLSVSLMEAMASELPVICSRIRGNIDLIDEENGGYFFNPNDEKDLADKILSMTENLTDNKEKMGLYNRRKVMMYSKVSVKKHMKVIYENEA